MENCTTVFITGPEHFDLHRALLRVLGEWKYLKIISNKPVKVRLFSL